MFDWSQYAVGGAASREDSFTGLNPVMQSRLAMMLQAAERELGPRSLRITSAYRSPELQEILYQNALERYGSEQEARRWVAPPGRSQHNFGTAVDFAGAEGGLLRDANSREAQWLRENAPRFGLAVPMDWEPWQVELAGAREGNIPDVPSPMDAQPAQQEEEFARGYEPRDALADFYAMQREQVQPTDLYNPYEIAQRFQLK